MWHVWGRDSFMQDFGGAKPDGNKNWKDLGVYGMIVLNGIFGKQGVKA
jgi:hypothetical protein